MGVIRPDNSNKVTGQGLGIQTEFSNLMSQALEGTVGRKGERDTYKEILEEDSRDGWRSW